MESKQIKKRQVWGVVSGKGGVGKSSLTVMLAYALQRLGYAVGILDADVYGPSIRQMLPDGQPPQVSQEGKLYPAKLSAIEVISLAFFEQFDSASIFRAPIANGVIQQFLHQVLWGDLDILLIDFPPGTGDIQLTLLQEASIDGALLLTTPQEVSLIDVRKSYEMLKKMHVPIFGVVENMSYYEDPLTKDKQRIFGEGGGKRLAKEIGRPFLKEIPIDSLICRELDRGQEIFDASFVSASVDAVWELAIELSNQICDYSGKNIDIALEKVDMKTCAITACEKKKYLTYSKIQKSCRCARCFDTKLGIRLIEDKRVDPNLTIKSYRFVGNYGVQFAFSSGCSRGIYPLEELINL